MSAEPQAGLAHINGRLVTALRRIVHAVEVHSHRLASKYDITGPQLACLQELQGSGSLTATALAQRLRLTPSTVVGILDRLEKKGLVQRQRDVRDRRIVNVTSTEAGSRLAAQAPSPLPDQLAEALGNLSALEQAAVALSLERVAELMDPQTVVSTPPRTQVAGPPIA